MFSFIDKENRSKLKHTRSSHEMFWKEGVLKNVVKFTGKRLCQSLFLIKLGKFKYDRSKQPHAQRQPCRGVLRKRYSENINKFTGEHLCESAI